MSDAQSPTDPQVAPRRPRHVAIGLAVTAAFTILDQITKQIAENVLERGEFVPLFGENIGWELVYNPGGAWGIPAPSWIFLVVTLIVVIVVVRALPRTLSKLQAGAYGLLLAGAIGNVIDRIFRAGSAGFGEGEVVDFVAWGTFPRFNVADSAITVGFVLLVFTLWRDERAAERALQASRDTVDSDLGGEAVHDGSDVVHPADRTVDQRPLGADIPTAEDTDISDPTRQTDDLTGDGEDLTRDGDDLSRDGDVDPSHDRDVDLPPTGDVDPGTDR